MVRQYLDETPEYAVQSYLLTHASQLAYQTRFASFVNRRAILSRLGVETASNSFHLSMSPSSVLAGGIWSVLHGYDL